jgi:hypothetical protein
MVKKYIILATARRKKYLILGSEGLKLRTSEKIAIAELRLRNNISLKVAELRFRKCFLQVAELQLRTKKRLRVPTSPPLIYYTQYSRYKKAPLGKNPRKVTQTKCDEDSRKSFPAVM